MKNKFLYIYYLVLILVLIFYTNMSGSPNAIVRLSYLAALVVPLFNNITIYPAVILCSLCISRNTFAYPLLPTEMYYYVLLSIGFALLAIFKKKSTITIKPLFLFILLYIAFNDIIFQGFLSPLTIVLFIVILFHYCTYGSLDVSVEFLSLAFIFISLAISYWRLFCPDALFNTYNSADGMTQDGWMDPNYLGCAMGTGLVISVGKILEEKRAIRLVLLVLTIVSSTIALLGLASRGMILAVATSVILLLLFSKERRSTKIMAIASLSIFLFILFNYHYFDFILARFDVNDGTGANRTIIWATKLNSFFEDGNLLNWIFGIGQKEGVKLGFSYGMSTHNDYLSVLIDYGLIGIILFIYVVVYPLQICSKEARPQIIAFLIYLLMCSMTLEPMARGNIAYIGFFFYVMQLASQSRQIQTRNV